MNIKDLIELTRKYTYNNFELYVNGTPLEEDMIDVKGTKLIITY